MNEPDKSIWTRRYYLPGLPRLPQPLFSLKTLRLLLFCLACLATLIALFYAEEDLRGKWAWESYMRQSKEKGMDLDWHSYIPPPVPDEKNFAMTPMLKPLFDYEGTVSGLRWRDTNWVKSLQMFSLDLSNQAKHPEFGSWTQGLPLDLKAWQAYFRGTNSPADNAADHRITKIQVGRTIEWPVSPEPQEPAADILLALTKFSPQLEELRQAGAQPYSRFPLHYQDLEGTVMSHLGLLVQASDILQLRSTAELYLGKNQEAVADSRLAFFCADSIKTEPYNVSQFVRNRIIMESLQPVWEGLRLRQWSEQDLKEFQQYFSTIDLLSDYERASKAEIAFQCASLEHAPDDPEFFEVYLPLVGTQNHPWPVEMLRWLPRGWYYQNAISAARFYEEKLPADVNPATQKAFPDLSLRNHKLLAALPNHPYTFIFKDLAFVTSPQKSVQAQTSVNLARIACGLERCRLARGHFPESLAALVPDFLDKLPHDIINGEPLQYRLLPNGQFTLYSIAWNEKDDGGVWPKTANPSPSNWRASFEYMSETGDWVWQYPEKP